MARIWTLLVIGWMMVSAQAQSVDSVMRLSDTLLSDSISTAETDSQPLPEPAQVYVRELQPAEPMHIVQNEQEWLAVIILIYWGLFAFLRFFNFNLFQYRWRAFLNFNIATQYFRDEAVFSSILHALYHVHYLLGVSLLGVLVLPLFFTLLPVHSILVWAVLFSSLLLFYLIRLLSGVLLSEVFQLGEVLRFVQFYSNLTYSHLAFYLMPVVTIGLLTSMEALPIWAGWVGVVGLILAIGVRYFRGLQVVVQYFGLFQVRLIAYICAVEIAPVVILVKTVQWLVFSGG